MGFKVELRKKWVVYTLILGVAALILLCASLNHKEHLEGMLEDTVWQETEDGSFEMNAFEIGRAKGKYTLIAAYDTNQEVEYRLVDLQQNDGKNHLGKEIASGRFPESQGEAALEFELEKTTGRLVLILKTKDESAKMKYWILQSYSSRSDFLLLFFLFAGVLFLLFRSEGKKQWQAWWIMAGAGIILTLPYMSSVLMEGDDLSFHLERIMGLAEALQSGQFPVRLNPCFESGYGFSSSMMYPELFLYIPAVLCIGGVSVSTAYKFLLLCINLATAGIGYYSFRRVFDSDKLGLVCALFYLVNPYRLVNMYHRAAVGEALAQVFLPLLFWGVYELVCWDYKKWWVCTAAATGIIQSHILSVEMCLIFVALFVVLAISCWWKHERAKRMLAAVKAGVAAAGLNMWFLIPFLDHFRDDNYIRNQATDMQNSALDVYELFRMAVKYYGPYVDKSINRQEFITLGGAVLFGVLAYCFYLVRNYMSGQKDMLSESLESAGSHTGIMTDKRILWIGNMSLGLGAISCYLAARCFPWNTVKEHDWIYQMVGVIQFPWRFLIFAALFFSAVMGIVLLELWKDKNQAAAGILVGLAVFMTFSCMDLYSMKPVALNGYSDVMDYRNSVMDYYAEDTDVEHIWANGDTVVSDDTVTVSDYERKGMSISFSYSNAKEGTALQFPIYNYGMHRIYLNGQETEPAADRNHQLTVMIPKGCDEGSCEVRYHEPAVYIIGNLISILTLAGMAGYQLRKRKRLSMV